jgi:hypothetical protein
MNERNRCRLPVLRTAVIVVFLAGSSSADHLPDRQLAHGAPERRLGRIVLEQTARGDLVKLYGAESEEHSFPDAQDQTRGERRHLWKFKGGRLEAGTWFRPNWESAVTSVDVWGQAPEEWARTGTGLNLGGSLEDLQKSYGTRYAAGRGKTGEILWVFIQWRDGNELHVDFDRRQKIDHIQLVAPLE